MLEELAIILCIITAVICMCSFGIATIYGRGAQEESLLMQRRFLRFLSVALAVHLLFSIIRFVNGRVEIINTMSLLSLFFVIEGIFYATLALNNDVVENRKSYRKIFNQVLLFLFAIHLYARYIMGYHDIYYNFADFFRALEERHISFFIRSVTVIYLTFYIALMIRIVRQAIKTHNEEMLAEGKIHTGNTRMGRLLYQWSIILAVMILGQFVGVAPLQPIIPIVIGAQLIYTCRGYLRLCATETKHIGNNVRSANYHKLQQWLSAMPFPLRESLTMDDIAREVGIDRDTFSAYIYELRGLTFTSWVRDHRLEYCQQRLRTTNLTLSEIAYESGYGELSAMSKAFKKKYGVTPSTYRKLNHLAASNNTKH